MDLYLPLLPALTAELGAATSTAQLTVTACLLGLALGQLIAGPLSDRFGPSPPAGGRCRRLHRRLVAVCCQPDRGDPRRRPVRPGPRRRGGDRDRPGRR